MTIGMQREKSAAATAMRMSDLLFGFIWQALFTADEVSRMSVAGALLVSSSILIIVLFKQSEVVVNDDSIGTKTHVESTQEDDDIDTEGELLKSRDAGIDGEVGPPSIQSRLSDALTSAGYAMKTLHRISTVSYERIETNEHCCVEMATEKQ
jgi:hypothetical protein